MKCAECGSYNTCRIKGPPIPIRRSQAVNVEQNSSNDSDEILDANIEDEARFLPDDEQSTSSEDTLVLDSAIFEEASSVSVEPQCSSSSKPSNRPGESAG